MSECIEKARNRVVLDAEQNQVYNRKWEKKFKWLAASENGEEHYYCKVCKRHNYGGLRQITLHCTTRTHMNALASATDEVSEASEASVYFVENRREKPRPRSSVTPKKRRIPKPKTPPDEDSGEGSPDSSSSSKKTELIHLKTYTSAVDGKKIILGMERRLEPVNKPKITKVIRQAVAPYSRHSETTAAVKTIEQSEAGLLLEEEEAAIPAGTLASPVVTIKTEGLARNTTSSNINRMTVFDERTDQDTFAVFGKHVANKLRTLTTEQNKFAQKLIMDVLFEGEMESLDRNTKVVKCGVSCVCQQ